MGTEAKEPLDVKIDDSDLPVLSAVAIDAMAQINTGEPSASDLEKLIRRDPALAMRILRLANSPLHAGRVKIASISQAVVRLGMRNLKEAILVAATGEVFDHKDPYARAFWEHAISVGYASHWLAKKLGIGAAEDCFLAGMLHDIGKLIIYKQVAKAYGEIIDEAALDGTRFYLYEKERLRFCTHESVGALVGRKWALSPEMIEVIRFHHEIEDDEACVTDTRDLVSLVSVANLVANKLGHGAEAPSSIDVVGSTPASLIGFDEAAMKACEEELEPVIAEQLATLG